MKRILLVEDNELNRDMLSRRLIRRGFQVLLAVNGLEALHMAEANKPDIILMDMDLPLLNGWEATRAIRQNPAIRHIPVLALTAHALPADRLQAMEAGCDAYQSKPVDFAELISKIDEFTGRQDSES